MNKNKHTIWSADEYYYPMACGFIPNLMSYLHDDGAAKRPCIIVVPGGGYRTVAPSEAELVAKKFYGMGYNTFVLTYTTNLLAMAPLKKQPMNDLSRAVRYIRLHADELGVDGDRLVLCGFSAGGHLCSSLCVHHEDVTDLGEYEGISNRPDAALLCYPVISTEKRKPGDSFTTLCGPDASAAELDYMSVEKHVTDSTPPCFLWHTATDELVPAENSLLFVKACRQNGIRHALHIFSEGPHGLSLADDDWVSEAWGEEYTAEQKDQVLEKVEAGEIELTQKAREVIEFFENPDNNPFPPKRVYEEISVWPELADKWRAGVLGLS